MILPLVYQDWSTSFGNKNIGAYHVECRVEILLGRRSSVWGRQIGVANHTTRCHRTSICLWKYEQEEDKTRILK